MRKLMTVRCLLDEEKYERLCRIAEGYRSFGNTQTPEELFEGIMSVACDFGVIESVLSEHERILKIGKVETEESEGNVDNMEKEHSIKDQSALKHNHIVPVLEF